jgi:PAS domain S-box-containing protein
MTEKVTSPLLGRFIEEHLFDLVPSAIAVIDRDFRIAVANRTFEDLFGEWRGRRCYEVYKGLKRRCPRCPAARVFRDGQVQTHHEVGLDRQGRTAHYVVHIAPVRDANGEIPFLVEMSTDVTRQSELREELARVNALNRALVDSSGDAIVALDLRGRVTLWNPAATRMFQYEATQVFGRRPPKGILPADFAQRLTGITPGPYTIQEFEARSADGSLVPCSFRGVVLTDRGKHIGAAAFFHDLRELKLLEREKLDAERLAAVGQTVAGLAHGIKNILTGLEGGLYLMRSGLQGGRTARIQQGFEMLERNLGRVSAFVRTLLEFSRGREIKATRIDPAAVAADVVSLFRDAAARFGIRLSLEVETPVEPAPFDPEGLHTCLSNLVTNAIDACEMSDREDREVVIRLREEPDEVSSWLFSQERPTVIVFEVRDNGIGMDYEVKQKVFTNFFTTKGEGGTGIGLLQTRKIVQEHGGRIEVESESGQGTVFRLRFPRRRLPQETSVTH